MQLISFFYSNMIKCNIKKLLFIADSFQMLCGEYGLRNAPDNSYAPSKHLRLRAKIGFMTLL